MGNGKGNPRKHKRKRKKGMVFFVVFLLLAVVLGLGGYGYSKFAKIKNIKLPKNDQDIGIKPQPSTVKDEQGQDQNKHKVTNILLLGVDNQEDASDSIIVFSLDDTSKIIKMTSLMRDSYIYFGEDKVNKLNYAYHYGGPQLSVKTINENYKLDIRDYIKVDFGSLDKIVDSFGGVYIDVKPEEVKYLNNYVNDIARIEKTQPKLLKNSGRQLLNGQQAVAYCRIRYVGDNDFERTERQRRVLKAMFQKMKDIDPKTYPKLISDIAPYLETSLDFTEMLSLGTKVMGYGKNEIMENRLPYKDLCSDSTIKGIYYLQWDKEKNVDGLQQFIYLK